MLDMKVILKICLLLTKEDLLVKFYTSTKSRILLLTDPNLSPVKIISDGIFSLISGAGDNK